jgi:hypothetical protein
MVTASPERCPTCRTAVPEGAARCPACGRVFGEENRCPHCHAVAAVRQRGGVTVCAACGKPRTGSAVLGRSVSIVPAPSTSAMLTRARGRSMRGFGAFALGAGVLAAAMAAALFPGAAGIVFALVAGLIAVGIGGLAIRAGARAMQRADTEERLAREAQVLALAEKEGGTLTASRTAKALGLRVDEADALLTGMVGDGSRIEVDVDPDGVVLYEFRELRASPARVRVETSAAEEAEEPASGQRAERMRGEPKRD